jgi:prepilin-type N-terminal cleavage/methylation domain-containing protein
MTEHDRRTRVQGGFSLVELIVAVVLLGAILVTLGGLSFRAARTSLDVANSSLRQGVSLGLVNHLMTIDYDSLTVGTRCDTAAVGNNQYRRCATTSSGLRRKNVLVTVTPLRTGSFVHRVFFTRSAEPRPNPLF